MKLMCIGPIGSERPVVLVGEHRYGDVSDEVDDYDEAFFAGGGLERVRTLTAEREAAGEVSAMAGERVGAPIARPHQILCIGLKYRDHAAETGQAVPDEPVLFTKSPNTLVGPDDDVRVPRGATKTDWEVELGVVMGRRTSNLEPGDLINTGTPPGVGMGMVPPVWLQPGDVMELGITGLGTQRQRVVGPR